MDFAIFVSVWLSVAVFLIFLLLFGESPTFIGTPIASAHWFLTQGIWESVGWVIQRVCGDRGSNAVEFMLVWCCDRPNPTLQLSYMLLLTLGYWLYCTSVFVLLDPASSYHWYTGTLSLVHSLVWWVAACRSDPGAVTPANLCAHRTLYGCDGAVWPEKTCPTCAHLRPARSKHCRVCNVCVARQDHHCGWINNCVGLGNHRVFLAFLAANTAMTGYGAGLGAATLMAAARRAGVVSHKVYDITTSRVRVVKLPLAFVAKWCVRMYPVAVACTVFMVAATAITALFTAAQLANLAGGKTQYEVYRWRDLYVQYMEEAAQREAQEAAQQEGGQAGQAGAGASKGRGKAGKRGSVKVKVVMPGNIYNRGWWPNLKEVLWPHHALAAAHSKAQ